MKTILILAVSLSLVSCDKFSRDNFLSNSFGADLQTITSGKKTKYSDGLFLVFDVSTSDALYSQFFADPYDEGDIWLSFGDTEFEPSEDGKIQYRRLESFDGYTKTIFYIPKRRILGFGYSDGLM